MFVVYTGLTVLKAEILHTIELFLLLKIVAFNPVATIHAKMKLNQKLVWLVYGKLHQGCHLAI